MFSLLKHSLSVTHSRTPPDLMQHASAAGSVFKQDPAVCLPLCKLCSRDVERRPEIQLWLGRFSLSSFGPPTQLSDEAPV